MNPEKNCSNQKKPCEHTLNEKHTFPMTNKNNVIPKG